MDSGSESETEVLINSVRERPFLYDKKDSKYKKIYVKKAAWDEIASRLPSFEDAAAVERRWNSLRGKYSTELIRIKSGDSDPDRCASKWRYFDSLAFLRDHVNPRTSNYLTSIRNADHANMWPQMNDLPVSSVNSESNTTPDQYYSNLLSLLNNDDDSLDNLNENHVPSKKTKRDERSMIKSIRHPPNNHAMNNMMKVPSRRTPSRIFGEYIGEVLEEMDGETGMEVQLKIMQVLLDARKKQPEFNNE